YFFFSLNSPSPSDIYTLSLHDALPICSAAAVYEFAARLGADGFEPELLAVEAPGALDIDDRKHATDLRAFQHVAAGCGCEPVGRSEEHTSELQSRSDLVCRLLLEKKKK